MTTVKRVELGTVTPGRWRVEPEPCDPGYFLIITETSFKYENDKNSGCDIAQMLSKEDAEAIVAWHNGEMS